MSKKVCIIAIILLLALLILTGSFTIVHYFYNYSTKEWFQEKCGEHYTVIGKEIGSPLLNGKSKAQIEIYDNNDNRFILSFNVDVKNDGLSLSKGNYDFSYNDEFVKITLYTFDKKTCGVYRFYFIDLVGANEKQS